MNKLVLIIIAVLLSGILHAKKLDSLAHTNHKEFYLDWDNDIFASTDHYYSQGLHLFWTDPMFRKNPLNHVMLRLKNADNYFGIGLVQEMYTPKDIVDTLLNTIDRPYAGTLFLRSYFISSVPGKRLKLTTQFDLGILGPLSGAAQAQRIIHEWTGSTPPEGWDFQIDNRPYINYNLLLDFGLLTGQFFELNGISRVRAGNIHDDLRLGLNFRTGLLNNSYEGTNFLNKKYSQHSKFTFTFFGNMHLNVIAYNATLMGGIIPPASSFQFTFKDIENFIVDFRGGVEIAYNNVGLRTQLTWKSKEFENGEDHKWGTIALFFRL